MAADDVQASSLAVEGEQAMQLRSDEIGHSPSPVESGSEPSWRRVAQIGHVPDWARMRLELALDDASQGRLDGVVGHYLALRHLAPEGRECAMCDGFRALGELFDAAEEDGLSELAHKTASLVEGQLSDSARDGQVSGAVGQPDGIGAIPVVRPAST